MKNKRRNLHINYMHLRVMYTLSDASNSQSVASHALRCNVATLATKRQVIARPLCNDLVSLVMLAKDYLFRGHATNPLFKT